MNPAERVILGVFLFVVVFVYGVETLLLLRELARRLKGAGDSELLTPFTLIIHVLALVGLVCFGYGYFVEPYSLELNEIDLKTHNLEAVSLRIVQISDLHCDRKTRNEPKLAGMINPLKPDLIVFTGDCVNHPDALEKFHQTLAGLKAKLGKFAVRGNIDVGMRTAAELFKETGFHELDSESLVLEKDGESFCVAGLNLETDDPTDLVEKLDETVYTVFLHHYPGVVEDVKGPKVDLYLCGHTHGGQVALPFYGALITLAELGKKYERGLYYVGPTTMYVNRGIGMEGGRAPRVRFFSRPEIAVFDIRPEKRK
ncbi:MAG: metallophosphoesterase [Planctomycetes bacterium]|nr:metallophosphoesterase [Planctomycetota bacterium]